MHRAFHPLAVRVMVAALALFALTKPLPAQSTKDLEELVAYDRHWGEAVASLLTLATVPEPALVPLEKLKAAQTRLELAVVRLINARPPRNRLADHLFLLPSVQEVAAAALAVVQARERRDVAGLESSSAWLEESMLRLAEAARMVRAPAVGR